MPERRPKARHVGVAVGVVAVLAVAVALVLGTGSGESSTHTPAAGGTTTTESSKGGRARAGPLTIVALGDSVPTATACGCTGYVELLATHLGTMTGRATIVHNDATDGWTTTDVVEDLGSASTRSDLHDADLVVIEIGANDFDFSRVDDPSCYPVARSSCWGSAIAGLRTGLARIIAGVRADDVKPDLRLAVVGYWNVTVDGAVGRARGQDFVAGSDALTRAVNAAIAQVARQSAATYVDAYTPLKGSDGDLDPTVDLLDDGDHPNHKGHQLLMEAVLQALVREGAVDAWQG